MIDRKEQNREVFEDTRKMIRETPKLRQAVAESSRKQQLYLQGKDYDLSGGDRKEEPAEIVVSRKRSFEAAAAYIGSGQKVCVLNFASATNPGGGVARGASAQEECLCRCSTLYPCLNVQQLWDEFYQPHRNLNDALYNDDCLYTPDVYVIKTDTSVPQRMNEADWYKVDILTCAAPNLRRVPSNQYNPQGGRSAAGISPDRLRKLLQSRIKRIFQVASSNGADVLILGAFGCGAFRNPPKLVAEVFRELTTEYQAYFSVIEYAVFCRDHETENFDAFKHIFKK